MHGRQYTCRSPWRCSGNENRWVGGGKRLARVDDRLNLARVDPQAAHIETDCRLQTTDFYEALLTDESGGGG